MVEFIRDVVVAVALVMSLFTLAYHAPGEPESVRGAAPALVSSGKITVPTVSAAPAVNAAK